MLTIPASVKSITGYVNVTHSGSGTSITTTKTNHGAFEDMASLTNVTFASNNITRIGAQAFKGCSSLTTINLPSSVSLIGNNAFEGCSSLNAINLENVAYIGNSAFSGAFTNVPVSSITIQADKASYVGSNAFSGTTGLKTVDFSKNTVLQTVSDSAFMNSGVTNLDLSKATKLITIGQSAFQNAASLATVNLPSSVTSIGNQAFQGSGLTSLDLSSTQVTTIGQGAFTDATKLETLTVPNTLATINSGNNNGKGTFSGTGLTSIDLSQTKITQINDSTFRNIASLGEVKLPSSVTLINDNAFRDSGLTSIDLSNTKITTIAESTFDNASSLATVKLPATVTSISQRAFNSTSSLKTLTQVALATPGRYANSVAKEGQGATLSSSVTSIENQAFASTGLESIDLSETSITGQNNNTLGNEVFLNARSLSDVKLPNNLTQIQTSTFASTALTSFDLSQTKITSIPDGAFQNTGSLSTITLPTGLTSIGNNAFANSGISSINLDKTQVVTIGQGAFANTTALKTLKVPSNLTTLSSANNTDPNNLQATFYGSALESLDLSSTQITSIADSTFSGAAKLASVNLPAGVTSIGNKAFYGTTALKTLTQGDETTSGKLNDKITTIGNYAFAKTGLATIDLQATKVTGADNDTTHSFGNNVFWGGN